MKKQQLKPYYRLSSGQWDTFIAAYMQQWRAVSNVHHCIFDLKFNMSSFALLKSISSIAHINCIDALWPGKRCLSHGLYIYQRDAALFK